MKRRYYLSLVSVIVLLSSYCQIYSKATNRRMYDGNYGTHMTSLITAVVNTDGPVLEMGSGDFSTTILHALCFPKKRFLLTADSSGAWLQYFLDLATDWHHFQYVPAYENSNSWDLMTGGHQDLWDQVKNNRHWSVVFIDHSPGMRRHIDIMRLRNNTDVFVIHDTEDRNYQFESIITTFKYKYVDDRYQTQTTIVSDTIDVTRWFN